MAVMPVRKITITNEFKMLSRWWEVDVVEVENHGRRWEKLKE